MTGSPDTNTGNRYFYTDRLAALWMAKHFGMNFADGYGAPYSPDGQPIYIHQDSLHLLEPKVGDLITLSAGSDHFITVCNDSMMEMAIENDQEDLYIRLQGATEHFTEYVLDYECIRRDGRILHWPEREEV